MWRGGFRFEHICSRLFRLAVPHWFDHGSRFHIPLIEPDVQISRIRLSDKTSRLRIADSASAGAHMTPGAQPRIRRRNAMLKSRRAKK